MTWYPIAFLPPQIENTPGMPYSGAVLKAYAAGTSTPIPMATDYTGATTSAQLVLNAAGYPTYNGTIVIPHLQQNYKIALYPDLTSAAANSGAVYTIDNVQIAPSTNAPFIQYFDGDNVTATFNLSSNLGSDASILMVFADRGVQNYTSNTDFATDTIWTKGGGWTIGGGVATAAGAISTAIQQNAVVPLTQGQSYTVEFTVTASAGTLTPSIGGNAGTTRGAGTWRETIIAGATQVIAFTGVAFTGTLDNASVKAVEAQRRMINRPDELTLVGNQLTLANIPPSGTKNVIVFAPSLLLGAANNAAAAAATSEVNALGYSTLAFQWATLTSGLVAATDYSAKAYAIGGTGINGVIGSSKDWAVSASKPDGVNESAKTYAGQAGTAATTATTQAGIATTAAAALTAAAATAAYQWAYSSNTTMANPGIGIFRVNNAALASVTQISLAAQSGDSGNPNLRAFMLTWDDSNHTPRGLIRIEKDATNFVILGISGSLTDNVSWLQFPVTVIASNGSFTNTDVTYVGFDGYGNDGTGTLNASGTPVTGALARWASASTLQDGNLSGDITTTNTLVTTLAAVNSNVGSFTNTSITVNAKGLITAASSGAVAADSFGSKLLHVRDEKTAGTSGGSSTGSAWTKRTLNTVKTNEISGASLATDQITLPVGTYYITASVPMYEASDFQIRLQNITDTTTALIGTSEWIGNTTDVQTRSFMTGRLTIAATKVFELQYYALTGAKSLGLALGQITEVYSDIQIWKVA